MSYKPYAKYKPTGVEWIGEIPEGWGVLPFRYLFDEVYRYPTYFDIDYVDSGIPEIRGECLADRKIVKLSDQRYISPETNDQYPRTILKKDDIVMSVRGTMGKIGLVGEEFVGANITANLLRLSPIVTVNSSFLCWLLTSERYLAELDSESPQTTIKTVTMPRLLALKLSIPSPNEQTQIATFLDRKTTQIDKLIEIKRKQIELLKEERTAIINQAVTKGLNPDAKMKESGVEWIGEIPERWEVGRLKHSVSIVNGQVDPRITEYKKLTLIAPNHIEKGTGKVLFTETAEDQGADSGKYLFSDNDVLYSKIRPALQKACLANDVGLCSADMYPLTANKNLKPKFLLYHLLSARFTHFAVTTSERVAMPKINRESLSEYSFPLPTICEQDELVEYIEKNHNVIDSSITKAQQQIQLLQEYRTTLISDAVTGKIDIREEAA